jgi:hypothetical protein
LKWIRNSGVDVKHIKSYRDSIGLRISVADAERLFETTIHAFQSVDREDVMLNRQVGAYLIPKEVPEQIQLVTGMSEFPTVPKHWSQFTIIAG